MQTLNQPNKPRVPLNSIEHVKPGEGGYTITHYEGEPFNGYMILDYNEDGSIQFEEEYKSGKHLGWDNLYFQNGKIKEQTLSVGNTVLQFIEYNKNGKKISDNLLVDQEYFNELVEKYALLD